MGKLRRKINQPKIIFGIMSLKILKLGKYRPIAVNYKE